MEPLVFERLKTLLNPIHTKGTSPGPRVAIRKTDRLALPSVTDFAACGTRDQAYQGTAYISMAFTCRQAIHLMSDLTSMETAQAAMTELVRIGMRMDSIDWLLIEQYRGDPVPTLAQLQTAFCDRLLALGFTSITQTVA